MLIEEQRFLHEDLERLEQAIADRMLEEPKNNREQLNRDHEIAGFLDRIQEQSQRLLNIYEDPTGALEKEIQSISTGDTFDEFYKQLDEIKKFHRQYPNEPVENLEKVYRRKAPGDAGPVGMEVDRLFSGEEGFGRYFDLNKLHDRYLNLSGVKGGRRLTYLQYLDVFDIFTPPECPIKRPEKLKDEYFRYVTELAQYLETFFKKIKPLEDHDKITDDFIRDFQEAWDKGAVPGWEAEAAADKDEQMADASGVWCDACEKTFANENVYKGHLTGKKHLKNEKKAKEANGAAPSTNGAANGSSNGPTPSLGIKHLKERAVAEREHRIRKFAAAMQTQRTDTKVNVERRQGMTERERQQELDALTAISADVPREARDDEGGGGGAEGEGDEKIYNPLKLPLAWDGKPIPFWLYKLHGLGVEFNCEICGNFVYMGRRAFDKHFNEQRHIYGLKCLGITNTALFREITSIEDAQKLWAKLEEDKRKDKQGTESVVQMEDSEGNVMPEKVYYDLQRQGLL